MSFHNSAKHNSGVKALATPRQVGEVTRAGDPKLRALAQIGLALFLAFMGLTLVSQWHAVIDAKVSQIREPQKPGAFEDYVVFYSASRLVLEGDGSHLYDIPALQQEQAKLLGRPVSGPIDDGVLPYFNPPFAAALLTPFAGLPAGAFAALLFCLVLLLIATAAFATDRFLELKTLPDHAVFAVWFLSLGSVTFLAIQSQLSMVPLLGWLGFVSLQLKGRQRASGFALALTLLKPQLAIVAVALLVWQRQWESLKALAMVAVALAVVSILVSGPGVLIDYPRFLIQSSGWEHEKGVILENMYGWSGFYARMLDGIGVVHSVLTYGSILLTLALAFVCLRGPWPSLDNRLMPLAGVAITATLLISLHLYRQDLSLLALVVAFGAAYCYRTTGRWGVWPLLAAGLWLVQYYGPRLLFEHDLNIQTPAIVALMLVSVRQFKRAGLQTTVSEQTFLRAA